MSAPQGGPLSPILSNILLDDLDKELERRGLPFVRYAERIMASVSRYLTDELRLVVNQEKSRGVASAEFEFLGFAFVKSCGDDQRSGEVRPQVQAAHPRDRPAVAGASRWTRRMSELRSYVRGWMGYFGLASQLKLFDRLDQWIRRRIRMCYWKQWRRPETSTRNAHSARRSASSSDPSRTQSQRLLAHGQNHCQRRRADQRLACRTRTAQHEDLLGPACSASSNRLVRTRTLRGVGRAVSDDRPYPIYVNRGSVVR